MADNTAINTAHKNPIITQVNLPDGQQYDIHDQYAVHGPEDLDRLGIAGVFNFAGVVANVAALEALTGMSSGDVYLVSDTKAEYVYLVKDNAGAWYEFGGMHSHTHSATIKGTNSESAVTVTVPTKIYAPDKATLSASQAADKYDKETVLGDGTTVSVGGKGLGTVDTTALDVSVNTGKATVVNSVNVGPVNKAISSLTTTKINNPSSGTTSIPQYSFTPKTASKVTLGTAFSIPNITIEEAAVTASKASLQRNVGASKITNVTARTTSKVSMGDPISVPKVSSNSTVTTSYISKNDDIAASKLTGTTQKTATKMTESSKITASDSSFTVKDGVLTIVNTPKEIQAYAKETVTIDQYSFDTVTATYTEYTNKDSTKTIMAETPLSIPNVTSAQDFTTHFVEYEDDSIPVYSFTEAKASKVKAGTAFTVPNVTKAEDVTASEAASATAITVAAAGTTEVTVVTGIEDTVDAVSSVSSGTTTVVSSVSASLVTDSADQDAVTVVTGVAGTDLTATVNPESIQAITNITKGAITVKAGNSSDVVVGITATDSTVQGSGKAAAQTWTPSEVTINSWSDNNQVVTPTP